MTLSVYSWLAGPAGAIPPIPAILAHLEAQAARRGEAAISQTDAHRKGAKAALQEESESCRAPHDGDGARSQSYVYWWEQQRCCAEIWLRSGVKTVNAVILPRLCPVRTSSPNNISWIDGFQNGLPSGG
jgi:hypothetical protein